MIDHRRRRGHNGSRSWRIGTQVQLIRGAECHGFLIARGKTTLSDFDARDLRSMLVPRGPQLGDCGFLNNCTGTRSRDPFRGIQAHPMSPFLLLPCKLSDDLLITYPTMDPTLVRLRQDLRSRSRFPFPCRPSIGLLRRDQPVRGLGSVEPFRPGSIDRRRAGETASRVSRSRSPPRG